MNIDTTGVKAIFTFTSETHVLVHQNNEWTINARIDRSYKGKDDDISEPIIHILDSEAESLKKSGFAYMIISPNKVNINI